MSKKRKRIARRRRIDRNRLTAQVSDAPDLRARHQAQKTVVAAKERKEFRLRADRRLALSFDIGDDIVEAGHCDLEFSGGEIGHLLNRAGGCLQLDPKAFAREKAFLERREDRPVESARKDIHAERSNSRGAHAGATTFRAMSSGLSASASRAPPTQMRPSCRSPASVQSNSLAS